MDVRVSDVKKWAGREERTTLTEPWPEILQDRLEAAIEQPATVDVLVRNVTSGLLVEVSGDAYVHVPCARCLSEARVKLSFADSQEFREGAGPEDPLAEYRRFTGDRIPLDVMVSDAVAVEMPIAPLCVSTCRGLCPQCGVNWNLEDCTCEESRDTRWDVLRQWNERSD
jgi:uncharacterized protein